MRNFYGHLLRYCTAQSIARVSEFRRWAAPQNETLARTADKRGAPPTMAEQAKRRDLPTLAISCAYQGRLAACIDRSKRPAPVWIYTQWHGFIWKDLEGALVFSNVLLHGVSPEFQFRRYGQRHRTGPMKSIFKIHVRRRCVRGKFVEFRLAGGEVWLNSDDLEDIKKYPFLGTEPPTSLNGLYDMFRLAYSGLPRDRRCR